MWDDSGPRPRRKVVFVGDQNAGKTKLISALCERCPRAVIFAMASRNISLIDIEVKRSKRTMGVELWNTAVYEDYDRARPSSYPASAAIALCFAVDSSKSFDNIQERWMPEILHFCSMPKVPIILVGCKSDLRRNTKESDTMQQGELISSEKAKALAASIGAVEYVECSGREGDGIGALESTIWWVAMAWDPKSPHSRTTPTGKCAIM